MLLYLTPAAARRVSTVQARFESSTRMIHSAGDLSVTPVSLPPVRRQSQDLDLEAHETEAQAVSPIRRNVAWKIAVLVAAETRRELSRRGKKACSWRGRDTRLVKAS